MQQLCSRLNLGPLMLTVMSKIYKLLRDHIIKHTLRKGTTKYFFFALPEQNTGFEVVKFVSNATGY